jgi:hypothetical protein
MFEKIEIFINQYGLTILLVYIGLTIIPLLLINTEHDAQFIFAFKYLFIPILIISYLFIGILEEWRSNASMYSLIFLPLITALIITVFSCGYISAINIIGYKYVAFNGKVIKKDILHGTDHTTYRLEIYELKSKIKKQLDVSIEEYHNYNQGDLYTGKWKLGLLGIPFKMIWE